MSSTSLNGNREDYYCLNNNVVKVVVKKLLFVQLEWKCCTATKIVRKVYCFYFSNAHSICHTAFCMYVCTIFICFQNEFLQIVSTVSLRTLVEMVYKNVFFMVLYSQWCKLYYSILLGNLVKKPQYVLIKGEGKGIWFTSLYFWLILFYINNLFRN